MHSVHYTLQHHAPSVHYTGKSRVNTIQWAVKCTLYSEQFNLHCSVNSLVYIAQFTEECTLYSEQYSVHYTVNIIVHIVQWIEVSTLYSEQYSVHCTVNKECTLLSISVLILMFCGDLYQIDHRIMAHAPSRIAPLAAPFHKHHIGQGWETVLPNSLCQKKHIISPIRHN